MSFPMHLLKIYCVAPENIHTQPKEGYREFQGEAISKAYIFLWRVLLGVSNQKPSLRGLGEN